jgi:hypothetical protein
MKEEKIQEISESIKSSGAVAVNNILGEKHLNTALVTLDDVLNQRATAGEPISVYPINFFNILAKILKLDFKQIKKTIILKKIAKDLKFEKIARKVFEKDVILEMIDSYYSEKSNKKIIDWHCDIADAASNPNINYNINRSTIKFFIYMSDVQSGNGCLAYIPYSHHVVKSVYKLISEKKIDYEKFWKLKDLRSLVSKNPIKDLIVNQIGEDKLNLFLENSKFIDENEEDTSKFDFEMKKGSAVIFDEFGVHRGAMPSKNSRLVLRFFYRKKN